MTMAGCVRKMVDIGHSFDVRIYPCISNSRMCDNFPSLEAWRAAAMNIWHTNADGVYTFNRLPRECDDRLSQIGDVATLKGRDKVYGIDPVNVPGFIGVYKPGLFAHYALHVELNLNSAASVELPVGEDIVASAPVGKKPNVKLLLIANVLDDD